MLQGVVANRDLYALLNLKFTANSKDILGAYRRAALVAHPDKGGTKEAFHSIKIAFEVLSCSTSRSLYNRTYTRRLEKRRVRSLSARNCSTSKTSIKRPFLDTDASTSHVKRRRRMSPRHPTRLKVSQQDQQHASGVQGALEHMRVLLQSMTAQQRLSAIQSVQACVRASLLAFMQQSDNVQPLKSCEVEAAKRNQFYKKLNRHKPLSGLSGVRVIKSNLGTRYRAHLVIKGLRLYTNTLKYETAIDHHIIFVQMRDAVAAESANNPHVWTNPMILLGILNGVLTDNRTTDVMIGLNVFVYMRATPWLDKNTYIVSPVMQLQAAVVLCARLMSAQMTSWECLRAEWVQLLQCKKKSHAKKISQTEAQMIVDQARQKALRYRFQQAELSVKRAMKRDALELKKTNALGEREQRRVAMSTIRVAVLAHKAEKQRRKMWQSRKNHWRARGRNMTMEHIMRGTYPQP